MTGFLWFLLIFGIALFMLFLYGCFKISASYDQQSDYELDYDQQSNLDSVKLELKKPEPPICVPLEEGMSNMIKIPTKLGADVTYNIKLDTDVTDDIDFKEKYYALLKDYNNLKHNYKYILIKYKKLKSKLNSHKL